MSTAAAIVLACSTVLGLVWFAFTRNGRHATHVLLVAVHRLFAPAEGEHALDQPAGVRDMLREITLAAAWHMPRYWWWRDRLGRAVRGCLPQPETPRAPAADSAPGEGTAPETPASGAVPLPPGGKLHPYRDSTPTRAERYSLRVPSYHSDPAPAVGAATGDFPRLIP